MNSHPDIEFDLWEFYRVDIAAAWAGRFSVRRVLALVERLHDEPWSRYRAHLLGGEEHWREHLGWGPAEYLSVAQINAIQANSAITAAHGSGKRPRQPEPFYRPTLATAQDSRNLDEVDLTSIGSLDELPLAAIEAMMNS